MIDEAIELSKKRVGADAILIANNGEFNGEEFLFSAKPTTRYFKTADADFIKEYDEVDKYTYQFYINDEKEYYTVIGVDFETDFLLKPWLKDQNIDTLEDGEIILCADIEYYGFYNILGETFKTKSSLHKTGTTMDNSIYVNIETARKYAKNNMKKKFFKNGDAEEFSTAVFVKLKEGKNPQVFADKVNYNSKEMKSISKTGTIYKVEDSILGFIKIISILGIVLLVNSFLALFGRYTSLMKERKKEIGYLRSLGFSKGKIYLSFVCEILIISVISGLIASLFVIIAITPILNSLSKAFLFPSANLSVLAVLKIVIFAPLLSFILGALSSIFPAVKTAKMEPREAMARGEM